jgi:hypothetical protein
MGRGNVSENLEALYGHTSNRGMASELTNADQGEEGSACGNRKHAAEIASNLQTRAGTTLQ